MSKVPEKVFINWSSGKDASLALFIVLKDPRFKVERLLTTVNESNDRINMHELHVSLLKAQAAAIELPLDIIYLSEEINMEEYKKAMTEKLSEFQKEGVNTSIFGDIFLEDLKQYREDQLATIGMKAHFPLWNRPTLNVIEEFINSGFKAVVVSINNEVLDKSFCGREIDKSFVKDLPRNVDPCGENGEFHTFCYDGPIFKKPIRFSKKEKVYKTYDAPANNEGNLSKYGFWFQDLEIN